MWTHVHTYAYKHMFVCMYVCISVCTLELVTCLHSEKQSEVKNIREKWERRHDGYLHWEKYLLSTESHFIIDVI